MAKVKLSRAEKKKNLEEKKLEKLEKIREKIFPPFNEPSIIDTPIISESPIVSEFPTVKVAPDDENNPKILHHSAHDIDPKNIQNPDSYKSLNVEFSLASKDVIGTWDWGLERSLLDTNYTSDIEPYLEHPRSTKWGSLILETHGKKNKTKHHHIDIGGLRDEIQQRWSEIELDYPEAFTFRVSGKKRIWGYRIVNKFFIVWWDPKHEIIPQ